eukprot:TRINITY_DN1398_c0_g1_i2.p1 TRINITY_DN1398_c0_g1~~TRINITY_DN1398_c0_g1_i2.p1  ORF type:complete len:461 (-),score=53.80 TRINITY_DN1398_c0_g1_i2:118-1500(-)
MNVTDLISDECNTKSVSSTSKPSPEPNLDNEPYDTESSKKIENGKNSISLPSISNLNIVRKNSSPPFTPSVSPTISAHKNSKLSPINPIAPIQTLSHNTLPTLQNTLPRQITGTETKNIEPGKQSTNSITLQNKHRLPKIQNNGMMMQNGERLPGFQHTGSNIQSNSLPSIRHNTMQLHNLSNIQNDVSKKNSTGITLQGPPITLQNNGPIQSYTNMQNTGSTMTLQSFPTMQTMQNVGNNGHMMQTMSDYSANHLQYHAMTDDYINELISRKRKAPDTSNERRVRYKYSRDAIQCEGRNRKKKQQCRNAALMEFIGPRPRYCAEHIHLDPDCLYRKCNSTYHKQPGDEKKCREVVLKEYGLCHKHYQNAVDLMVGNDGYFLARKILERTNTLLSNLENEAKSVKKSNPDLYQRKNKLIPKFQEYQSILVRHIAKLDHQQAYRDQGIYMDTDRYSRLIGS